MCGAILRVAGSNAGPGSSGSSVAPRSRASSSAGQQAVERTLVDDRRVVGRGQRRVARRHDLARRLHEGLDLRLRQPQVVDRGADLPGVEELDEQDALGRHAHREVVAHDGRRTAAEFQRHRAQVLRRGSHHQAAGGARACEQQVVERQPGEFDAHAAGFVEELQLLGREVGRDALDQQPRQVARVLAHLDHGAVAGGKDGRQRHQAQVDRKIPGHDHADHAQRLRNHPVARAEEGAQVHAAPLRLHPAAQVPGGVVDAVHGRHDLRQQRLVARAVAIVGADRVTQRILVLAQRSVAACASRPDARPASARDGRDRPGAAGPGHWKGCRRGWSWCDSGVGRD